MKCCLYLITNGFRILLSIQFLIALIGCDLVPDQNPGQDCPVGTLDCACGEQDICAEGLMCEGRLCQVVAQECVTGEVGCGCNIEGECQQGLVCVEQVCSDPQERPVDLDVIGLADPQTRSCEFVLEDDGGKIHSVVFANEVEGGFEREGKQVAVAFFARADEPLPNIPFEVRAFAVDGGAPGYRFLKQQCFDRFGRLQIPRQP